MLGCLPRHVTAPDEKKAPWRPCKKLSDLCLLHSCGDQTVLLHSCGDQIVLLHSCGDQTVLLHSCEDQTVLLHSCGDQTVLLHSCGDQTASCCTAVGIRLCLSAQLWGSDCVLLHSCGDQTVSCCTAVGIRLSHKPLRSRALRDTMQVPGEGLPWQTWSVVVHYYPWPSLYTGKPRGRTFLFLFFVFVVVCVCVCVCVCICLF